MIKPYCQDDFGVLYHGDCLEIMPQLDIKADMVLCDPPYGKTQNKWDSIIPFEKMWERLLPQTKVSAPVLLFGSGIFSFKIGLSNERMYRYSMVWEKTKAGGFLNARRMPMQAHEDILVFYSKRPTYNPQFHAGNPYIKKAVSNGDMGNYGRFERQGLINNNEGRRFPRSVMKISNDNHASLHPTQKPIPLMEYLIRTYTNAGETVLDFAAGSGTTGVAAINTLRKYILIEKEEKYCEIAAKRLSAHRN